MTVKDEFKIQRQGKTYVLFAGLLDEFHERWPSSKGHTRSLETELVQIPDDSNGNVAIVKAVAEVTDEEAGDVIAHFEGIGDASPGNVGRNIAPHIIRMAETRAKARALRDLLNVNAEPNDDGFSADDGGGGSSRQSSRSNTGGRRNSNNRQRQDDRGGGADQPASDAQRRQLEKKILQSGDWDSVEDWEEGHQLLGTMTVQQANDVLKAL